MNSKSRHMKGVVERKSPHLISDTVLTLAKTHKALLPTAASNRFALCIHYG